MDNYRKQLAAVESALFRLKRDRVVCKQDIVKLEEDLGGPELLKDLNTTSLTDSKTKVGYDRVSSYLETLKDRIMTNINVNSSHGKFRYSSAIKDGLRFAISKDIKFDSLNDIFRSLYGYNEVVSYVDIDGKRVFKNFKTLTMSEFLNIFEEIDSKAPFSIKELKDHLEMMLESDLGTAYRSLALELLYRIYGMAKEVTIVSSDNNELGISNEEFIKFIESIENGLFKSNVPYNIEDSMNVENTIDFVVSTNLVIHYFVNLAKPELVNELITGSMEYFNSNSIVTLYGGLEAPYEKDPIGGVGRPVNVATNAYELYSTFTTIFLSTFSSKIREFKGIK